MPRPPNWKSLAPPLSFTPPAPPLPRLPVLPLSETISKLRRSLHPLRSSDAQYEESMRLLDEFAKPGGMGEVLQARLEERERLGREGLDGGEAAGHWLERWWDDGAYMAYRDSVVVNVSYYYGFTPSPSHLPPHPAFRAASLTRAALLFRRALYSGQLVPDTIKDTPLCMDTYRWMFDCSRVPGVPADWAVSYAWEGAARGRAGHVVVLRKNRFWKVEVGDGRGGLMSTEDLEKQFAYIYAHSSTPGPAVGILSGNNRDAWSSDYTRLTLNPTNASHLRTIHSAAFLICLDSSSPSNIIDFSRSNWHAGLDGTEWGNRWYDKPLQFLVYDNGRAGFMGEHSVMDGTPTVRLCDSVCRALHDTSFDHGPALSEAEFSALPKPEEMEWHLTEQDHQAISQATESFKTLVESQSMSYLLTSYGKAQIKKYAISPDSWAQMLIQLAWARLHAPGEPPVGTYEAATTRRFAHGRTETIRTVSDEVREWVEAMMGVRVDGEGNVMERKGEEGERVGDRDGEKRGLFRRACARHGEMAREAGWGRGVDRHMFGLRHLLLPGETLPAIYSDPLYKRASTWRLSTSAIFSEHFPSYGWGEVVPDGFGVAYMTGYDDKLQFTITSRKEMPNAEFCREIERAAEEVKELFDRELEEKSKSAEGERAKL